MEKSIFLLSNDDYRESLRSAAKQSDLARPLVQKLCTDYRFPYNDEFPRYSWQIEIIE